MFSERLKKLRKENKLTQNDIADIFNVSFTTVSSWELDKSRPSYETLVELAKYFNVTTDYLLVIEQDNLLNLKIACESIGISIGPNFEIEDFEKAMRIVNILKEKKDTKN